jgi:hypothetical protein
MTPLKLTPAPVQANWRATCTSCGASIIAKYPGDVRQAAQRRGWTGGQCAGCKRGGS